MKENRKESKVVICPGAIYNGYVEHQNIFGVMNVYPSGGGEAGQKSQSMAHVGQIGKPSHKGRNSEHLFALDDACYLKDEVETRQQVSLFCRFLEQNRMQGEPISAKVDSPLNIAIFLFCEALEETGCYSFKTSGGCKHHLQIPLGRLPHQQLCYGQIFL